MNYFDRNQMPGQQIKAQIPTRVDQLGSPLIMMIAFSTKDDHRQA
jgi:hypothetical protein